MTLLLTLGQWGDAPQTVEVLDRIRVPRPLGGHPRTGPDHVSGDKAYSSRRNRRYLRRRHIRHTIPEPGPAGGDRWLSCQFTDSPWGFESGNSGSSGTSYSVSPILLTWHHASRFKCSSSNVGEA